MFGTDLGDVNNDEMLDLVSIGYGSIPGFHVYLNQDDGTWIPSFGMLSNNSEFVIQFTDLNNDGYGDFIDGHALGTDILAMVVVISLKMIQDYRFMVSLPHGMEFQ